MGKLAILNFNGDFTRGFEVKLEIGLDEERCYVQVSGKLPSAPQLEKYLNRWEQRYLQLGINNRIKPKEIIYGGSVNSLDDLRQSANQLKYQLKAWLESKTFYCIDRRLREELDRQEQIRLILSTQNQQLARLPWCLWDFIERYPKAEIALSTPAFERSLTINSVNQNGKVRILAILGNSQGIDLEADRQLLSKLTDAEIVFLVEPQRQQLNSFLWEKSWDIIFFAGHSETRQEKGLLYLNNTDELTITELKYGLKKAIAQGLQLAIFNSCDGLGLAYELEQLSLPQTIVMREPIPDRIAHEFLKYFLEAFAGGDSLYLSTRYARERLQGWEHRYPCASWLPVIYQNPAIIPPDWQTLKGAKQKTQPSLSLNPQGFRRFYRALIISFTVSVCLMNISSWGWLQNWELAAFDQLMLWRPSEPRDNRFLIITVDEEDIQYQQQQNMERHGSLADAALQQLLIKLKIYQPRIIASDIIHDFPYTRNLAANIEQDKNFFAICRIDSQISKLTSIKPPPNLPIKQIGFSNFAIDDDNVIRRQILGMSPSQVCPTDHSLSWRLALSYLDYPPVKLTSEGLWIDNSNGLWVERILLPKLEHNSGGYSLKPIDAQGVQTLINYRAALPQTISLRDILKSNQEKKLKSLIEDRIILIGVSGHNQDLQKHPYNKKEKSLQSSGVFIHAQMASQIISAVLDGRPLIWWFPEWIESFWIVIWSMIGGMVSSRYSSKNLRVIAIVSSLTILWISSYLLLIFGGWIPVVSPTLTLLVTAAIVTLVYKKSKI